MVSEVANEPLLRWIPLLPLLSALTHGLWLVARPRPAPRGFVVVTACGPPILSAALVCVVFARLLGAPAGRGQRLDVVYTWFGAGIGPAAFSADVAFRLDPLSAVLALLVAGIGVAVHISAVGGSAREAPDARSDQRSFALLNLLFAAALTVVLADEHNTARTNETLLEDRTCMAGASNSFYERANSPKPGDKRKPGAKSPFASPGLHKVGHDDKAAAEGEDTIPIAFPDMTAKRPPAASAASALSTSSSRKSSKVSCGISSIIFLYNHIP